LLLCLGRLRVVLIVGTKRKFDSSSRHFFLYFLYMSNISNRLDEIELKQEMSKRIFFQLNKEIKKIRKFVDEYCDSPDAPNACKQLSTSGGFRKRKSRKKRRKKKRKTRKRKKSRRRRKF